MDINKEKVHIFSVLKFDKGLLIEKKIPVSICEKTKNKSSSVAK